MRQRVFLVSDTHFGHENMCKFTKDDGSPMRPFQTAHEADEVMVENWNRVVRPGDKVYHLGDVCMKRAALDIMSRLNGTKILIKGNHDQCSLGAYREYFKDVRGIHRMHRMTMSHIPLHPGSIYRNTVNVHGHLHHNLVRLENGEPDLRYLNVCVEHTDFTPISFEEVLEQINDRYPPVH